MKHILVITAGYCGKATANGLCTRALVDELRSRNISLDVISSEEKEEYLADQYPAIPIRVKKRVQSVLGGNNIVVKCLRYLKQLIRYFWIPKYDKDLVKNIQRAAEEIISQKNPEIVLCMFFPVEALIAGCHIAKKHPECKFVVYELDSVSDGLAGSVGFWGRYILPAYRRLLKRIYRKAKKILILKCHKVRWSKEFKRFIPKMSVVDLPLLCDNTVEENTVSQKTQLLYSGVLDGSYRSPKMMLETFSKIKNDALCFSFYSRGCEQELSNAARTDERITAYGYVDQKELNKAIQRSAILLNIGNKVSNSLPSKLITYMTYGKPIIHFSLQEEDVCVEYLKKYPLSLLISKDETPDVAAKKVEIFINEVAGKRLEYSALCGAFSSNLPSYSVDVLLNDLE